YYLESNGSMIIRVDVDGGNTSVFGVRRQDENSNLFEVDESGNIGVVSEVRLGSNQATVPKMYADGGNFVIQLGQ
ncbi:MAG: hypothetical protein Q8P32_05080, partial [Candidatus Komeilibacteria bacterium]|nr:hypothetical protein [Candidatus Komeilibacteria bacterium]